jgi:hypothetical protein
MLSLLYLVMLKAKKITKVGRLKKGVHSILPTLKFKIQSLAAEVAERRDSGLLDHRARG